MTALVVADTTPSLRDQLRRAVFDCRERGLHEATAWAAQQLNGLPDESNDASKNVAFSSSDGESDALLYAKSLFDCKSCAYSERLNAGDHINAETDAKDMQEYQRCAHILSKAGAVDSKSLFVKLYALYLAGERRKHEEKIELSGALGKVEVQNRMLDVIGSELEQLHSSGQADAFCLYLYGMVLADWDKRKQAREVLAESLMMYPCNWSAWKALQSVCKEWDDVSCLKLPDHVVREFFIANMSLELQWSNEALARMHGLSKRFPRSDFLVLKAGIAHYNMRKMDEAQELFEDLVTRDEFQLEGMDVLSNILYMKEDFASLSHLAHTAVLIDKYRPETCCIVGNYYSLKGQHEKAVMYFQRALKLDPNYLSALTLMGHEYVEMKNPNAAIESYRRAVDLDSRDFRAWYGLGQTYEMLIMPYYAIYYFRRAAQLRPYDARMWVAMGQCYAHDQLKMYDAAAKCYRRAVTSGDHENIVLHKLAELYKIMQQYEAAFSCYKQNLECIDQQNQSGQDAIDALTYMAEHCIKKTRYADAELYAMRLQDFGGPPKDKGRQIMEQVKQHHAAQAAEASARSSSNPSSSTTHLPPSN